ncbi:MAG TPA: hypothetical protein VFQ65_06970 [Kofleriaceae bacterium]|nr:hypothetical protein [Kofleriaceae bacterium]
MFAVAGVSLAWMSHPARAGEPAWCKGEDFKESSSSFGMIAQQDTEDPRGLLDELVKFSCSSDPGLEAKRGDLDKLRAEWSKNFAMNDADWGDALAYAKEHGGGSDTITMHATTFATMSPIDQYVAITKGFDSAGSNPLYVADVLEGNLTDVGRMGFLMSCADEGSVTREDGGMSMWAICQGDADKLDANKLSTELRGDTSHSAVERMRVRIKFYTTREKLKKNAVLAQKLIKKDDAYKKMFDAAAKGRAEWAKTIAANKDLLDLVQAMDSAVLFQSRKQFAGCEDKTATSLAAAVTTMPAKSFATMHDDREDPFKGFATQAGPILVNNAVVNLAATAYALCHSKTATGRFLSRYLQEVPGMRGPRGAAFSQLLQQKFDLDDLNLKEPPLPRIGPRPFDSSGGEIMSAGGVVKGVKPGTGPNKGKSVVNLEKTSRKQEDCVKEHTTNRIVSIRDSGTVEYERICDKTAIVTHDTTWNDFTVTDESAKVLKPGLVFSSTYGAGLEGEVIALWPNKDAKLPSVVLGGKLK